MTTKTQTNPNKFLFGKIEEQKWIPLQLFNLRLALFPTESMNSNGKPYFKQIPKGFEVSKTDMLFLEFNLWPDGEPTKLVEKPKPFGEIILEDEKISFSGAMLKIAEFLSSEDDMKGVNLQNNKIAFEIVEIFKNEKDQKIIYLHALNV